ncbi:Putative arginine/ornithine antiporter [Kluyvera cryocrescens]|uniref:Arginine/ornithine antiporter n=1 Tax=Kluyvera cryocrescens TaxID=580 RepID=A0A485A9A3_KLUCR|nr:Putative arginine/ornithine antiporter [Kluyvera cryocrescens]
MEKKLGLSALTALVLSSMLGAGVFSLPQNMAQVASPAALLIGWAITGIGILFLAVAMLVLTRIRPDLDGGIFTYAREGFWRAGRFLLRLGLLAVRGDRQRLLSGYRLFRPELLLPIRRNCACLATATPGSRLSVLRYLLWVGAFSGGCAAFQNGRQHQPRRDGWLSWYRWACLSSSPPSPLIATFSHWTSAVSI